MCDAASNLFFISIKTTSNRISFCLKSFISNIETQLYHCLREKQCFVSFMLYLDITYDVMKTIFAHRSVYDYSINDITYILKGKILFLALKNICIFAYISLRRNLSLYDAAT